MAFINKPDPQGAFGFLMQVLGMEEETKKANIEDAHMDFAALMSMIDATDSLANLNRRKQHVGNQFKKMHYMGAVYEDAALSSYADFLNEKYVDKEQLLSNFENTVRRSHEYLASEKIDFDNINKMVEDSLEKEIVDGKETGNFLDNDGNVFSPQQMAIKYSDNLKEEFLGAKNFSLGMYEFDHFEKIMDAVGVEGLMSHIQQKTEWYNNQIDVFEDSAIAQDGTERRIGFKIDETSGRIEGPRKYRDEKSFYASVDGTIHDEKTYNQIYSGLIKERDIWENLLDAMESYGFGPGDEPFIINAEEFAKAITMKRKDFVAHQAKQQAYWITAGEDISNKINYIQKGILGLREDKSKSMEEQQKTLDLYTAQGQAAEGWTIDDIIAGQMDLLYGPRVMGEDGQYVILPGGTEMRDNKDGLIYQKQMSQNQLAYWGGLSPHPWSGDKKKTLHEKYLEQGLQKGEGGETDGDGDKPPITPFSAKNYTTLNVSEGNWDPASNAYINVQETATGTWWVNDNHMIGTSGTDRTKGGARVLYAALQDVPRDSFEFRGPNSNEQIAFKSDYNSQALRYNNIVNSTFAIYYSIPKEYKKLISQEDFYEIIAGVRLGLESKLEDVHNLNMQDALPSDKKIGPYDKGRIRKAYEIINADGRIDKYIQMKRSSGYDDDIKNTTDRKVRLKKEGTLLEQMSSGTKVSALIDRNDKGKLFVSNIKYFG